MLYDEFMQGTGCRDNADNYKVYKDLEILYMNSDLTKEQIYEYGKKLINNALTASQIEWNNDIDEQIAGLQEQVEYYKGEAVYYEQCIAMWHGFDADMEKGAKRNLRRVKNEAKYYRQKIRDLKTCKYV